MVKDVKKWQQAIRYSPEMLVIAARVLEDVRQGREYRDAARLHPLPAGGYVPKHAVVAVYRQLVESGEWPSDPALLASIRMKPTRTASGVSTVTVLTKPHPCPGQCIFCPSELQMPKSYLQDEPGAARAFQNQFDPFLQVKSRLDSYQAVGHPIDKIELLILGGSWSVYPADYQAFFTQRCLDAMNRAPSANLADAQQRNESAPSRNVGMVIETRPELITMNELIRLRQLGVTKVQMGAQSMDDKILALNKRGHTVNDTLLAVARLRAAGFKIVLHWMPNLLGATLASDHKDFTRLWQGLCPDEIKIYPVQLLENSELFSIWKKGKYQPYTTEELISLIADLKPTIPPYCRVNRVIRDIPSPHIVAGNKRTSLRQDILAELAIRNESCECIRCHEVRTQKVTLDNLHLEDFVYTPDFSEEHFLTFRTPTNKIAGYLRLSLPGPSPVRSEVERAIPELKIAAIVRELHVFGQSLSFGREQPGAAQHVGLGTRLLQQAETVARQAGFGRLAVISAIGTRRYYEERGFTRLALYHGKSL